MGTGEVFVKGWDLSYEALAHINKSMKLIATENALEENPRTSFRIAKTVLFGGMSMHRYICMYF